MCSCYETVTVQNHQDWFQGKLDWLLVMGSVHPHRSRHRRRVDWVSQETLNMNYSASDHRALIATLRLTDEFEEVTDEKLSKAMPLNRARPGLITCATAKSSTQWRTIDAAVRLGLLLLLLLLMLFVVIRVKKQGNGQLQ